MPVSIRIAGNTTLPTLLAIQAKGYKLNSFYTKTGKKLLGSKNTDKLQLTYEAEKDGCRFSANDPEELLGLIAMWEMRGHNWQYNPKIESDIRPELMDSATIYYTFRTSICNMQSSMFLLNFSDRKIEESDRINQ